MSPSCCSRPEPSGPDATPRPLWQDQVVTFNVMFVCTGNICRSPMAERLFASRVDPTLPIATSSSGPNGLDGWPMDATCARALREIGGNPDGHRGRLRDAGLIDASQLILTAETGHRN